MKHLLRWSLKSARPLYLERMSESGPITTARRRDAMVFPTRRAAMLHPANLHPGCGFEPVPVAAPAAEIES